MTNNFKKFLRLLYWISFVFLFIPLSILPFALIFAKLSGEEVSLTLWYFLLIPFYYLMLKGIKPKKRPLNESEIERNEEQKDDKSKNKRELTNIEIVLYIVICILIVCFFYTYEIDPKKNESRSLQILNDVME